MRKEMTRKLLVSVALFAMASVSLLSGCSNEAIDDLTQKGSTATSGVIQLANKTSIKLGSTAQRVRYAAPKADMGQNKAYALERKTVPAMPADAKKLSEVTDFGWNSSRNYAVNIDTEGQTYKFPLAADVFITGKTTVDNVWGVSGKEGVIYVVSGGELTFDMVTLTGVIVSEGKLNIAKNDFTINHNSAIHMKGDLNVKGKLNVVGDLYVDGNLTCNDLDVNNNARIHVTGEIKVAGRVDITNGSSVNAEGKMSVKTLNIDSSGNLLASCAVFADKLTLHNKSVITISYVQAKDTEISASTVNLLQDGVANLGNTVIGSVSDLKFNVLGEGEAMVVTDNCHLKEQYSLTNNIGGNIYFNYNHFFVENGGKQEVTMPGTTADGWHKVEIGTNFVNKGTPNEWVEGKCNPGFKKNKTSDEDPNEDPNEDPGADPSTPSNPSTPNVNDPTDVITVTIPTDISREWFLEADDFAIRVDGEYLEHVIPVENKVEMANVKISERNLVISVENVKNLDFSTKKEYTYEVWLWVKEESWQSFTAAEKETWVSGDTHGTDITNASVAKGPEGYEIRYNVYKGLGGQKNTPYIKVSVHVTKKPVEDIFV